MSRQNFNDLSAFTVVATEGSFTKAAAKLGISASLLSQTIRHLEARLGVPLLTRTTRSVLPTEAGEQLLRTVSPKLVEIETEVTGLGDQREQPAGTIRITAGEHSTNAILAPGLIGLLAEHPNIKVEISIDLGLTDIVAERYDAGVRLGERVAKDMIAVPISPMLRWAVVGSPAYFARHATPEVPQDLGTHHCVNVRFPTHGGLFAWDFEKEGRTTRVRVDGPLTSNIGALRLDAALRGLGLAYLAEDIVAPYLADCSLVRVLADWCPPLPGYYLYYPNRRHPSVAFSLLIDALRYRGA